MGARLAGSTAAGGLQGASGRTICHRTARRDLEQLGGMRERRLGEIPAVAEGPQLLPSMVAEGVRAAVWLMPDGPDPEGPGGGHS